MNLRLSLRCSNFFFSSFVSLILTVADYTIHPLSNDVASPMRKVEASGNTGRLKKLLKLSEWLRDGRWKGEGVDLNLDLVIL